MTTLATTVAKPVTTKKDDKTRTGPRPVTKGIRAQPTQRILTLFSEASRAVTRKALAHLLEACDGTPVQGAPLTTDEAWEAQRLLARLNLRSSEEDHQ